MPCDISIARFNGVRWLFHWKRKDEAHIETQVGNSILILERKKEIPPVHVEYISRLASPLGRENRSANTPSVSSRICSWHYAYFCHLCPHCRIPSGSPTPSKCDGGCIILSLSELPRVSTTGEGPSLLTSSHSPLHKPFPSYSKDHSRDPLVLTRMILHPSSLSHILLPLRSSSFPPYFPFPALPSPSLPFSPSSTSMTIPSPTSSTSIYPFSSIHTSGGSKKRDSSKLRILPPPPDPKGSLRSASLSPFISGFPGLSPSRVSGTVVVQYPSDAPVRAKRLVLTLISRSRTSWYRAAPPPSSPPSNSVSAASTSKPFHFHAQDVILQKSLELWCASSPEGWEPLESLNLPFSLTLPSDIPDTLEMGPYGGLTLELSVQLYRRSKLPLASSLETVKVVHVPLDIIRYTLSTRPEYNTPISFSPDPRYTASRGIHYEVIVPRTAFGPGDPVEAHILLQVHDPSLRLSRIELGIKEYVEYRAGGGHSKSTKQYVAMTRVHDPPVSPLIPSSPSETSSSSFLGGTATRQYASSPFYPLGHESGGYVSGGQSEGRGFQLQSTIHLGRPVSIRPTAETRLIRIRHDLKIRISLDGEKDIRLEAPITLVGVTRDECEKVHEWAASSMGTTTQEPPSPSSPLSSRASATLQEEAQETERWRRKGLKGWGEVTLMDEGREGTGMERSWKKEEENPKSKASRRPHSMASTGTFTSFTSHTTSSRPITPASTRPLSYTGDQREMRRMRRDQRKIGGHTEEEEGEEEEEEEGDEVEMTEEKRKMMSRGERMAGEVERGDGREMKVKGQRSSVSKHPLQAPSNLEHRPTLTEATEMLQAMAAEDSDPAFASDAAVNGEEDHEEGKRGHVNQAQTMQDQGERAISMGKTGTQNREGISDDEKAHPVPSILAIDTSFSGSTAKEDTIIPYPTSMARPGLREVKSDGEDLNEECIKLPRGEFTPPLVQRLDEDEEERMVQAVKKAVRHREKRRDVHELSVGRRRGAKGLVGMDGASWGVKEKEDTRRPTKDRSSPREETESDMDADDEGMDERPRMAPSVIRNKTREMARKLSVRPKERARRGRKQNQARVQEEREDPQRGEKGKKGRRGERRVRRKDHGEEKEEGMMMTSEKRHHSYPASRPQPTIPSQSSSDRGSPGTRPSSRVASHDLLNRSMDGKVAHPRSSREALKGRGERMDERIKGKDRFLPPLYQRHSSTVYMDGKEYRTERGEWEDPEYERTRIKKRSSLTEKIERRLFPPRMSSTMYEPGTTESSLSGTKPPTRMQLMSSAVKALKVGEVRQVWRTQRRIFSTGPKGPSRET
ncbi:MAG: hypothetical protein DHS80DRAFT_25033 [Piptocephalis tieghemiana]|nr:MAG: hypothetical protein DHS80DRAFT_25033 [Piptocephalis tieghemiana]